MGNINYKGLKIRIVNDIDACNPREEWDNLGTMVCFHRRYELGDKNEFNSPEEFKNFLKREEKNIVVLPLYLYDHSGITMKTSPFSCNWDSGQVGCIFVKKEKVREWYGVKTITKKVREKVIEHLNSEVKTYDNYLTGEVYGYIIEDNNGENLYSCYGFYGYNHEESGLLEYAKNSIDCHISHCRKQHFEQLKAWIKGKVNFQYRKPCLE